MSEAEIYLASSSPRRADLLCQLGVKFEVYPVTVDEAVLPHESPDVYVQRLALLKARRAWEGIQKLHALLPVLGADTCIALDHHILGKPLNKRDAVNMLMSMSGRQHEVYTAIAIVGENRLRGAMYEELVHVSKSQVTFGELTLPLCERYWDTGEPVDKAGAYAIQGKGALFVSNLRGSYSGVVGLPLFETGEMLTRFGIEMLS